jgi:hypothetical protein
MVEANGSKKTQAQPVADVKELTAKSSSVVSSVVVGVCRFICVKDSAVVLGLPDIIARSSRSR